MNTAEWITLLAAIAAIALSALAYYRSGKPVTVEGVQEAIVAGTSLAAELAEVATMAVASAQQLKDSGKIDTNEAAFNHAFDYINKWFPALDRKIVAGAVEGAYGMYKLSSLAATTDAPQVAPTRGVADSTPPYGTFTGR